MRPDAPDARPAYGRTVTVSRSAFFGVSTASRLFQSADIFFDFAFDKTRCVNRRASRASSFSPCSFFLPRLSCSFCLRPVFRLPLLFVLDQTSTRIFRRSRNDARKLAHRGDSSLRTHAQAHRRIFLLSLVRLL